MSFQNNLFNHLVEADADDDGSSSSLQDLAINSSPTARQRHLRRNSLGPFSNPSEDNVEGSHYSPTMDCENSIPFPRTRSLDRLDSVAAGESPKIMMPGLPPPPSSVLASPLIRADSPAAPLCSPQLVDNRPSSPLLRMINQHPDLFPVTRDSNQPLQIMTARENFAPSRPAVLRTMSELGPEASSAPVTARDRDTSTSLQHQQERPMTPITEHNNIAAAAAGSSPLAASTPPHPANTDSIAAVATAARRDTRPVPSASIPAAQTLGAYLAAELHPGPSYPTTDVIWGQSERDRVYNALLAVPYQLERLLWLGIAVCMDSFLAVFTLLPLRVVGALGTVVLCIFQSILPSRGGGHRGLEKNRNKNQQENSSPPMLSRKRALRGDQIYDLLCALMFAFVVTFLWRLKAGSIYYWVKDLTQEFLKLSVLQTALELSDKICCSFLVDVLEALAASCTALAAQSRWSPSHAFNVLSDAAVALALLTAHGATLMAQALVFGVAMNSQKNTLLALLIASNFTEIKGTVLKRFDPTKIFVLASQDVVERFHLIIVLAFVLVEEMSGTGAALPSTRLLSQVGYVLLAEVVIDVTKHAVLGKFNEIRPGVYREFTKDLCEQLATAQSHTAHRLVGFEPFAPAALFFRVILSYVSLRTEDPGAMSAARGILAIVLSWAALAVFKLGLGYLVKRGAVRYLGRYEARRSRGRGGPVRGRSVAFVGASPAPVGAGVAVGAPTSPMKKEN
jgi:Eukaryotic membrane protein family